jgi:hypothetical protein
MDNNEQNNNRITHPKNYRFRPLILTVVVIALIVASFVGGMAYLKKNQTTANTGSKNGFSGFGGQSGQGRPNGGQMGGFGTVAAISSTSITVQNPRSGTSKTFTITSSTTVTNNGSTASISDIKTGDMVIVRPASSGSTTASQIIVNPTMNGGPGNFGGAASTD